MAETVDAGILVALENRMQSLALSPPLPIAWAGKKFTPPANGKYLRIQFIPNTTNRVFIGSNDPHQYLGLFQVSVHWPKGDFESTIRDVAGQVASHYPCDLRLTAGAVSVRVTARPSVADMLVEDVGVQIPVTVPYEAWA